jgi:hypothetical protein
VTVNPLSSRVAKKASPSRSTRSRSR